MMITERPTLCKHLRRPKKKIVYKKGLLREPRNPRERHAFVWSENALQTSSASKDLFPYSVWVLLEKDTNLANRCSAYVTQIYGPFFLEEGGEGLTSVASQIVLFRRGFGVVFSFRFKERLCF